MGAVMKDVSAGPLRLRDLSSAVDVLGYLTERSQALSSIGFQHRAMADTFASTYEHLVAYLRYLAIEADEPMISLEKAARGLPSPQEHELAVLRGAAKAMRPRES